MSEFTYYKLQIWRAICHRDLLETISAINQEAPPPAFLDRLQDDYIAPDEMASFGVRYAAQKETT